MTNSFNGGFKVGAMVVGKDFIKWTELNNLDGIIVEDLGVDEREFEDIHNFVFIKQSYLVEWASGEICEVLIDNLRVKKPPTDEDETMTGENIVMNMFKECEEVV